MRCDAMNLILKFNPQSFHPVTSKEGGKDLARVVKLFKGKVNRRPLH
jgi:hypothetical protein